MHVQQAGRDTFTYRITSVGDDMPPIVGVETVQDARMEQIRSSLQEQIRAQGDLIRVSRRLLEAFETA